MSLPSEALVGSKSAVLRTYYARWLGTPNRTRANRLPHPCDGSLLCRLKLIEIEQAPLVHVSQTLQPAGLLLAAPAARSTRSEPTHSPGALCAPGNVLPFGARSGQNQCAHIFQPLVAQLDSVRRSNYIDTSTAKLYSNNRIRSIDRCQRELAPFFSR